MDEQINHAIETGDWNGIVSGVSRKLHTLSDGERIAVTRRVVLEALCWLGEKSPNDPWVAQVLSNLQGGGAVVFLEGPDYPFPGGNSAANCIEDCVTLLEGEPDSEKVCRELEGALAGFAIAKVENFQWREHLALWREWHARPMDEMASDDQVRTRARLWSSPEVEDMKRTCWREVLLVAGLMESVQTGSG